MARAVLLLGIAGLCSGCELFTNLIEAMAMVAKLVIAVWAMVYVAQWAGFVITAFFVWRRRAKVGVLLVEALALVGWHTLGIVVANQPPAWLVAGLGLPVAALVASFLAYALREDPPRDPEELP